MRFSIYLLVAAVTLFWASSALASDIMTHKRTVEYKIVEPCDVLVAEGEVVLEWADCGGDYELVTIEYENYDHPITLLFAAGCPDYSGLDEHSQWSFLCHPCKKMCPPDVYCATCDPCDWYCYRTSACFCGDSVTASAYLPSCMSFSITDIY
jgi:hypothetical protein